MVTDPTGVGGAILKEIVVKTGTWGLGQARHWYYSYNLLILGQERSGKSSLYKFLRLKQLSRRTVETEATVDNKNSGYFTFEWKVPAGTISLELRNVGDRSGQIGPERHANMVLRKKPHLVIIILDITSPETSKRLNEGHISWFEWFCTYLENGLMNRPRRARTLSSYLRGMIVLLNKVDELKPIEVNGRIEHAKALIQDIMTTRLRPYLGSRVDFFEIMPCSIVVDPAHGTVDDTIARLQAVIAKLQESTI